jgi:L-ascorbate metabolism protein UlaG (beta-lactamase superfamily)
MDIQFYGANCVTITSQGTCFVVDDNLKDLGGKSITRADNVALFTSVMFALPKEAKLSINSPGEYEIGDVSITGIATRANMDEAGKTSNTMYKFVANDLSVVVLGHAHPDLDSSILEKIGNADVLVTPVGGHGYTLDPTGALDLAKRIEPSIIIPTYYDATKLKFPVPAVTLQEALQTFGMEATETTKKFRLKPSSLSDAMQLIVLEHVN